MTIDDDVLREAKRRAADANMTVSDWVNRLLRDSLRVQTDSQRPVPFRMVTYGGASRQVDHAPADFAVAMEEDDRAALAED